MRPVKASQCWGSIALYGRPIGQTEPIERLSLIELDPELDPKINPELDPERLFVKPQDTI
jgi:hypothetical protein